MRTARSLGCAASNAVTANVPGWLGMAILICRSSAKATTCEACASNGRCRSAIGTDDPSGEKTSTTISGAPRNVRPEIIRSTNASSVTYDRYGPCCESDESAIAAFQPTIQFGERSWIAETTSRFISEKCFPSAPRRNLPRYEATHVAHDGPPLIKLSPASQAGSRRFVCQSGAPSCIRIATTSPRSVRYASVPPASTGAYPQGAHQRCLPSRSAYPHIAARAVREIRIRDDTIAGCDSAKHMTHARFAHALHHPMRPKWFRKRRCRDRAQLLYCCAAGHFFSIGSTSCAKRGEPKKPGSSKRT